MCSTVFIGEDQDEMRSVHKVEMAAPKATAIQDKVKVIATH